MMLYQRTFWVLIAILAFTSVYAGDGGLVFGVKPSAAVQTSYFGIVHGKFVFYGGLDILAIGAKMEGQEVTYEYNEYIGDEFRTEEDYEYSGSAMLIAPRLGLKYRLSSHILRPYMFADFFKIFPMVNIKSEESIRYYVNDELTGTDEESEDAKEIEDIVKDVLGVWGFNLGFGAEYFFTDNFSVSGEYAFRWFATSFEIEDSEGYSYDSVYEYRRNWKDELSGSLKMTYAAICLNYYF